MFADMRDSDLLKTQVRDNTVEDLELKWQLHRNDCFWRPKEVLACHEEASDRIEAKSET